MLKYIQTIISTLLPNFALWCRKGLCPLSNLYSMQPNENQSAEESYAIPFASTSGAM